MMSDDKHDSDATGEVSDKSAWAEHGAEAEIESLRAEIADLKDRLLRSMAEMENLRRRTEREKADTAKYAISAFARDILSVGDNIRRAIEAVPAEAAASDPALKTLLDGVEVTERELTNALEHHGIKRLEPKGARFDPNLHQAMLQVENEDVPAGTVVDVLQAGYLIEDRVLRPALVSVSRGGAKTPAPSNDKEPAPTTNNEPSPDDDHAPLGPDGAPGPRRADVGGRIDKSA